MDKKFANRIIFSTYCVSLKELLNNKMDLIKEFNFTEEQIDNMPYWQFEESIKMLEYMKSIKLNEI